MTRITLISFFVLVVAVSLATSESGICSWYDAPNGAKTANGETFNRNAMTAAHKTLPFNTKVRVTVGNRAAVVRINDRGPFVKGRILDVTPHVADILNLRQRGVAPCNVVRA
ncbi:hypothetical protein DERP_001171 [Dermatophagoides pteronyssinus]|uniref:RlpA-like protein double-psi beta-barrel domain-containing protein n=1 Tax=Dermatophagoides pteronyssinus TaxID=6956 RepID=A0ABQ8JDP5_DERPT|nr:hypothetical protein DERP_001171 [Dermatophagoides pteronyssinus]